MKVKPNKNNLALRIKPELIRSEARFGISGSFIVFNQIFDKRINFQDKPNYGNEYFLVVIDKYSSREEYWSNINHQKLGSHGIYNLWRIKKSDLNTKAIDLLNNGFEPNWRNKEVEKF